MVKSGEKILLVSFGSGAGSDAFILWVTERIDEVRDKAPKTREMVDGEKFYVDYGTYAKFRGKIIKG